MTNTLKLEIVTPDAVVYSEDVEMVTLVGVEGQMGIYPQHVRLMTQLVPGEMVVHKGGHDDFLAVGEGLVEITNDRVAIVTDMAVPPTTSMKRKPKKLVNAPRRGFRKNYLPKTSHP